MVVLVEGGLVHIGLVEDDMVGLVEDDMVVVVEGKKLVCVEAVAAAAVP
jgi:hypothetical protein